MPIENALIKSTSLGYEDHGVFTYFLHLEFDCCVQGFGGFCLDTPDSVDKYKNPRRGTAFGHECIIRVLRAVGVSRWEDLPGTHVRIDKDGWNDPIKRIGHIIKDQWFDPKELSYLVSTETQVG